MAIIKSSKKVIVNNTIINPVKVYKIQEDIGYAYWKQWVTEDGKILETALSYFSGLQGHNTIDPCVDFGENWIDCNSSCTSLYWLTNETISKMSIKDTSIEEFEYSFNFKYEIPDEKKLRSQIGDLLIVTPLQLINSK